MANLQENTTYNKTGTQSPLANLSNISKLLQKNTQKTTSNLFKGSLDAHFNPDDYTKLFSPTKVNPTPTEQPEAGFPINTPIAPPNEGARTQPLPEGYNQFVPADQNANWVNPSSQAVERNWPSYLGGGQYITDPTQPGALIKSNRAIMDNTLSPGAKQKILGKLSPLDYQVDHIVPLWIGGADTLQNLEILGNITHAKKTAIQSVPLTLLANNKITLDQAKLMALSWKDKDASGLPTPDDKGYVPLDVAQRYQQKWEDVTNPSFFQSIKKYFGESFKENMANFGRGIPVVGEFAKGLVGGTGMVPATEALPETGLSGKIANFTGNLVTTITGIGLMGKLAAGVGLFGAAEKAATSPFLKYAGTGISALDKVIGVGSVAKTATQDIVAKQMTNYLSTAIKSAGVDLGNIAKVGKWSGVGTSMYRNAVALSLWGQLGLGVREATGQQDFEFQNHLKQAAVDTIYGGLLGSAGRFAKGGQSIGGYTWVGGATTAWSLIQGSDIQTAVQDGILMTALHGMGYKKGIIDPRSRIANDEAFKESLATAYMYDGKNYTLHPKGVPVPEIYTITPEKIADLNKQQIEFKNKYPDNPVTKNMVGEIKDTNDALYFSEQKALQDVIDSAANSKGLISQSDVERESTRIISSFNQLRNQTLPIETRQIKEWKDTVSMGSKLRNPIDSKILSGYRSAVNSEEVLKKIDYKAIDEFQNNKDSNLIFNEPTHIVGHGKNLGNEERITVNDLSKNPDNYKPYLVGVIDNNTQSFMRRLWLEQQKNPKLVGSGNVLGTQIVNPDATVRWFALELDPLTEEVARQRPVGYSPQESSFTKKNNVNQLPDQIFNRLQHTIKTYKDDPQKLMESINADQAMNMKGTREPGGSVINIDQAIDLADRIKRGEVISEQTLYDIIKPSNMPGPAPFYGRYSAGINNITTFNKMKENQSNYIVGDISKAWMSGGTDIQGTNQGRRKAENPNNPFLEITGMYIPGKEVKSSIETKPNMSDNISGFLNAGKTETLIKKEPPTNKKNNVIKQFKTNTTTTSKKVLPPETNNITPALQNPPKMETPYIIKRELINDIQKMGFKYKTGLFKMSEQELRSLKNDLENPNNSPEGKGMGMLDRLVKASGVSEKQKNDLQKNIIKEMEKIDTDQEIFDLLKLKPDNNTSPTSKTSKITSALKNKPKTTIPVEKTQNITSYTSNNDLVDQFYSKIVHDIEYRKVKPDSPQGLEKIYNNIINSFKVKNPGINEKDFKNIIIDAKSRARVYAENLVDDAFKGTKEFGTENIYHEESGRGLVQRKEDSIGSTQINPEYWRAKQQGFGEFNNDKEITDLGIEKTIPKIEKPEHEQTDVKLAKKFDLKLKEPNKDGFQNIELDKKGNPVFSDEYIKKHPNATTPLDTWGSFLGDELKIAKAEKSRLSKTWVEQIEEQKKSKNVYSSNVAKAIDAVLSEKYDVRKKNPRTGQMETIYGKKGSWRLNAGLKKSGELFFSKTDEGHLISEPYRNIIAGGSKKGYGEMYKDIARMNAKTRDITEKTRQETEKRKAENADYATPGYSSEDNISINEGIKSGFLKVKTKNQIEDVLEDLTPFDKLQPGLRRQELRGNLISRYNNIIDEMKPGRRIETRISQTGEEILGSKDEMNRLFTGITRLSEYIPESKKWKSGRKIVLKNNGELTAEEGVNDGIRIAAKIMKLNSSPGKVDFEEIKKALLKNNPEKGSASIGLALKAGLSALGITGLMGIANIGDTTKYQNLKKDEIKKLPNNKLGDIIMQMESSGGVDKESADKGEIKWKYGLTNVAIRELQRVKLIDKIDINNEAQVRDASIKYFNLMKERNPGLSDAEIYVDYYWGGSKGDQRERTIKKFNDLVIKP